MKHSKPGEHIYHHSKVQMSQTIKLTSSINDIKKLNNRTAKYRSFMVEKSVKYKFYVTYD